MESLLFELRKGNDQNFEGTSIRYLPMTLIKPENQIKSKNNQITRDFFSLSYMNIHSISVSKH